MLTKQAIEEWKKDQEDVDKQRNDVSTEEEDSEPEEAQETPKVGILKIFCLTFTHFRYDILTLLCRSLLHPMNM
jgi:hypothetical protein